ncbi:class I SAM-dependent methyltransferase [Nonomuraea aridisoli]|uniref:SAM-dependent methyltransferase n=1 Tax=Nonomuraea aridisoli TaxID=2070368 RepID=A0A2W2FJ78_9ACTN|nr:class I SAM-dependent methyltransferase [Nonomuraea aridisoli]PZG21797.1 SAM-dependent methyltransferase [Nonomuraea aridisoli]
MHRRHGSYGFDAPWALAGLLAGAVLLLALAAVSLVLDVPAPGVVFLFGALYTLASAASQLYTTRRGRFAVWHEELRRLRGDERLLDLGCGRGAVLLLAARRLETGRAAGVDRRRGRAARANAEAEGLADRVEMVTADPRDLPFEDGVFDVVVCGRTPSVGERAVEEACRVLRPGGVVLVAADVRHSAAYEAALRRLGARDVRRRDLGWRHWYGGPWARTELVEAVKPSG